MKSALSVAFVLAAAMSIDGRGEQVPVSRQAVPLRAVDAMLDAFRAHQLVGIGDAHQNEQVHAFRLALMRDPRFTTVVDDIVVEWGNSLYQADIDRYVFGEAVPERSMRRVLEDVTAGPAWDTPVYEEFFRTIRAVNEKIPAARRVRVLLGQPPIDWALVHSAADRARFDQDKDAFAAQLVRREVLARNRRGLILFGYGHLTRSLPKPSEPPAGATNPLIGLLDRGNRTRAFTVYPITRFNKDVTSVEADVATWPVPSLVSLAGTRLGDTNIRFYFPALPPELSDSDPAFNNLSMASQFDALLYVGPPASMTLSRLSPERCLDRDYIAMRTGRIRAVAPDEAAAAAGLEQLNQLCPGALEK